ncbi:MAG TPA: hypothetical protein VEM96_17920 [Pyrinomonadaceae bacterium]|nr:hypothetical protein [Pyrinomonadaceae bacterium]
MSDKVGSYNTVDRFAGSADALVRIEREARTGLPGSSARKD